MDPSCVDLGALGRAWLGARWAKAGWGGTQGEPWSG